MSKHSDLIETIVEEWTSAIDERNSTRMIEMLSRYFIFPSRLDIHLDWENIYYSLKKRGKRLHVEDILSAIKAALSQSGELVCITAYADWGRIQRECRFDVQRRLVQLGVETRYVLTRSNAADMAMANGLRNTVENGRNEIDTFAIVSGDGDFKPVIETIRQRGKRVIVVACVASLSQSLKQAANEVIYLDKFVKPNKFKSRQPQSVSSEKYLAAAGS